MVGSNFDLVIFYYWPTNIILRILFLNETLFKLENICKDKY